MLLQPNQLELPFGYVTRKPQIRRHIPLGNRIVAYTLSRGARRSIGMTIDHRGLRVGANKTASVAEIERFVRSHEGWVLRKLDEWQRTIPCKALPVRDGEHFPVLGISHLLRVRGGSNVARVGNSEIVLEAFPGSDLRLLLTHGLRRHAAEIFHTRLAYFAPRIHRPTPSLTLSNAQTRWGSCSEKSGIRLNWRLVHLPLRLIDYVVAHELSHLIEMNHSPRFWSVVGRLYPDYCAARTELKVSANMIPHF